MKIAYIITAYQDEINLLRLINALEHNSDFYIHVDLKSDISKFEQILSKFENVFFTKNRFFVNWGSFNQVLSQKELLRSVINSNKVYNRVICISGSDYPIWSNSRITDEFCKSDIEYIKAMNLSKTKTYKQQNKISIYHFFRDASINNAFVKKIFSGSSRLIMSLLPIRKSKHVLFENKLVDIYMGSDYWALTFECAKFVYDKMDSEKKLMNYFKFSFVPSEMCIPTIVFNSKYSNKVLHFTGEYYLGLHTLTPLHYIVYNSSIKVFTEKDYNDIIESDKMFVRKTKTFSSDRLIEIIDKNRNESRL